MSKLFPKYENQIDSVSFTYSTIVFSSLSDLYIAVICPYPIYNLIPQLMKAWGNKFLSLDEGLRFQIVSTNPKPDCKLIPIQQYLYCPPPNGSYRPFQYAYFMNFLSAKEFYYKTSLDWYFRTTYDCYVHLPHLNKLIQSLNSKYNPKIDLVMKGDHQKDFIHGGPGWIMSRALVKLYLDFEHTSNEIFAIQHRGDDQVIMSFTQYANLTFNDIKEPGFSGWPVQDVSYQQLIKSSYNYSIFPPCPHRPLTHVKDIIVWHNGRKYDYVNTIGRKIIDEAPPWFYIGNTRHIGGKFCIYDSTI